MKVIIIFPDGRIQSLILDKKTITIGRAKRCDIVLKEETLSRQHCRVQLEENIFYITDLNSANGIHLDGERIPSNLKMSLEGFKKIMIGPLEFHFELVSPKSSTTTFSFNIPEEHNLEIEKSAIQKKTKVTKSRRLSSQEIQKRIEEDKKNLLLERVIGIFIILGILAFIIFIYF